MMMVFDDIAITTPTITKHNTATNGQRCLPVYSQNFVGQF